MSSMALQVAPQQQPKRSAPSSRTWIQVNSRCTWKLRGSTFFDDPSGHVERKAGIESNRTELLPIMNREGYWRGS